MEVNRLTTEINRLLSKGMFLIQLKNKMGWEKEAKRLLSKGMSNINLTVNIKTFSKLWFSGFKKFANGSVFGEMISLIFKTSCCNSKIRGLGAKMCMVFFFFFFFFFFEKNYDVLKSKSPCNLLNKNINFNKKKNGIKNVNSYIQF